jgi:hypothetical protein
MVLDRMDVCTVVSAHNATPPRSGFLLHGGIAQVRQAQGARREAALTACDFGDRTEAGGDEEGAIYAKRDGHCGFPCMAGLRESA